MTQIAPSWLAVLGSIMAGFRDNLEMWIVSFVLVWGVTLSS
jgi:hypothetical protein